MHHTAALHHTPLSVSLGIFGKIKSTVDGDEQVRLSPEFFMLPNSYAMIFNLDFILSSEVQGYGITKSISVTLLFLRLMIFIVYYFSFH